MGPVDSSDCAYQDLILKAPCVYTYLLGGTQLTAKNYLRLLDLNRTHVAALAAPREGQTDVDM